MESFEYKSYAKLNLHLRITGRKPNQHHMLQMLSILISLHDEINLTIHSEKIKSRIIIEPYLSIPLEKNLIFRSIQAYWSLSPPDFTVFVKKNIPIEAGLGGGSSNAACTLTVLNNKYQRYTREELLKIGFQLGSDVPFFMGKGESIVSGEGEIVKPSRLLSQTYFFLIVKPAFSLSTKQVYTAWDNLDIPFSEPIEFTCRNVFNFYNDLLKPSLYLVPELTDVMIDIQSTKPIGYSMTGSGSAFFALYSTYEESVKAIYSLQKKYPFVYLANNLLNG